MFKLGVKDYVLLLRAIVWTAAIRVGLSTVSFRLLCRLLIEGTKFSGDGYTIEQIVWATRSVCRYVPKATCLTQALVVQRFLKRSGHRFRLRIGVAKDSIRGFEAHAWVECADRVVIGESVSDRFTPIAAWEG